MNCLRAWSSRASWRCMSSKAAASWPSSSSESGWMRSEKSPRGDLARRALEPLDAQRQRARHEVAAEHGDQERDPRRRRGSGGGSATRWPATSPSASANTATPRTSPPVDQRLGHERLPAEPRRLGGARRAARWRARPGRPTARRRSRRRRGRSRRARTASPRSPLDDAEHVDLGARARRRRRRPGASSCACGASEPTSRLSDGGVARARRSARPSSFWSRRRALELRRDGEVDDRDRGQHDQAEDQRQPVAQRADAARATPRRGSGSRRRAP